MSEDFNQTIRITKEEANSAQVDDMLKRQMSLRGEPGVTRDRQRKWYLQNWFVLGLAGLLGALVGWAVLEPYFNDRLYVEGVLTDLVADTPPMNQFDVGERQSVQLRNPVTGSFRLNGEKIHVLETIREIDADGHTKHLEPGALKNGDRVGVYVEYHPGPKFDLSIATLVRRDPPPAKDGEEPATLAQLHSQTRAASLLYFAVVAGAIGLFVGCADGIVCRLPRRALLAGAVGVVVGFLGGFICSILANLVYSPLSELANAQMTETGFRGAFGFLVQMTGRSLAWSMAGLAMGLGQGIALRSGRLLVYGLLGGVVGGLLGGLLFDPIDLLLLGSDKPSAHVSRMIGLAVIGATVGGMIGVVELLARDAWLRMTQGPLTGKEFLIFKDVMTIGSSPKSDLYLFNDPQVAKQHATIRAMGDECEIEARESTAPVLLNNRPVQRARLRHGDNVMIGRTAFVFQRRKG